MYSGKMKHMLRLRWLLLKNYLKQPASQKGTRWVMLITLGTLFLLGDYFFFFRIIRYLDGLPLQVGDELIVQLLNVVFLTLFVMVFFSSLIVSLSIFYLSADLNLLNSMPVRAGSFLSVRFMQMVIHSSWMVLIFSFPIFVAYGYYFQVNSGYYLYLILSLIPFAVIPCAIGLSIIMLVMRFFPTKRMHQVLSFFGLLFLVGLVVYLRFLAPEKFFGKEISDGMIILFVENLKAPDYSFLPSSWMTRGLTGWVHGDVPGALVQWSYLMATMVFCMWVLRRVARLFYDTGWSMVQEVRSAPAGSNAFVFSGRSLLEMLPVTPARRALLIKDARVFLRDPQQWSQMFILCALVFVYIFNILNLPLENEVLKNIVSVLNIGLVGFVLSALISRFVFAAPSAEGNKIWTIYTAPVDMEKFLWSKFWMFFPPLLVVAEFLVVVSNHLLQVDSYVMKVSIIGVFLITLGLVGLGLGLGAMYPRFNHENISSIVTGTGGILFMILSLSFVGLVVVLGARPLYVHFNEKFLLRMVGGIDVPICYTLILLLTTAVTFLPLRRGIQVLRRMDI